MRKPRLRPGHGGKKGDAQLVADRGTLAADLKKEDAQHQKRCDQDDAVVEGFCAYSRSSRPV
ncbi:hypothetical protein SDC9_112364 [bioreactor metagenome]|uniref:Uncharacterized protein n=1 Tax=bioreactor metagenome TaxID=1076179 RepID=A0A645BJD9_9ZZZZ